MAQSELQDALSAHAHDVDTEVQRLDSAIQDNNAAIDRLEEEVRFELLDQLRCNSLTLWHVTLLSYISFSLLPFVFYSSQPCRR